MVQENKHIKGWRDLLRYQSVRAMSDRSWDYFLPVYIAAAGSASVSDSSDGRSASAVSTTALLFAARALAGLLLTPIFSREWRPSRLGAFMAVENIGLVCSGVSLWYLWGEDSASARFFWLICAGCAMSFEKAASKTQTTNAEKNAVVKVTSGGTGNAVALSRSNARLVQVDLAFATVSPFIVSFLTTSTLLGMRYTVPFLIILQLCLAVATLPLALRVVSGDGNSTAERACRRSLKSKSNTAESHGSKHPSSADVRSPRLILLATCLLYFTVVSPGSLFLAYLKNNGMEPYHIATFASAGQVAGIAGSLIVPPIVNYFGLGGASLRFLAFQTIAVICVAATALLGGAFMLPVMCIFTVISRLGLWGVDLTLRQLVQTRTNERTRVSVFGMQEGLTQAVSLLLYAVVSSNAFSFPVLCALSACALLSALACLGVDNNT